MLNTGKFHNRKSPRLDIWDYTSPHWYFVTICTLNHADFFGRVKSERVMLNKLGNKTQNLWIQIPLHYKRIELDYFVIMPNHLHGIIILNSVESRHASTKETMDLQKGETYPAHTLGNVIGSFKSAVT